MNEEMPTREDGKMLLDETGKIDRRTFLVTVGKVVIPTLGILGLNLTELSSKVAAAACQGTCSGGCGNTCTGCFGCTGSCSGECYRTCRDICANSCTITSG